MSGEIGILNVGCGDTKLSFDKSNPAECIRAARIVTDMLRRGYALLVEIEQPNGTKTYQRVYSFKEDACEYIVADMDPLAAQRADEQEAQNEQAGETAGEERTPQGNAAKAPRRGGRRGTRTVKASETRGVAVARSAGG